jgi:CelD/BcsL family acetyltransferase involved in cellulose biosynthesis
MQLPWPLLWLDGVAIDTPRWQALRHALDAVGMAVNVDARFDIGRVEIDHDWQRYQAGWSRTHRRNMKRYSRKLQETGELELRDYTAVTPAEVEGLLRRGLEVEDRSWKGAAGTSVLRSEGMFEYFVRNSRLLAERGQLELVFLEHNGQPIAFELGWYAKGVYHAYKVGYDEAFAAAAPGQLLRYLLFERFYGESPRRAVDFAGVLSDATGKWCTSTYRVGRLLVAPRKLIGRLALSAYRNLWPHLRRLRRPATT